MYILLAPWASDLGKHGDMATRLLAGESVTIDAVCQAVNEPTGTTLEPEKGQKP